MKNTIRVVVMIMILSLILSGCGQQRCTNCDSADAEYEAVFQITGSTEYLCDDCYHKMNEYQTFNELWRISNI